MVENSFHLKFIKIEDHLVLPTVSSIRLTQELYDILFQYVITEEKEAKLKEFIGLLETHIKSKSSGPFSIAISEIDFLEDGLEELKLLNWMQVPVWVTEIVISNENGNTTIEDILDTLTDYVKFNRKENLVYIYPFGLTNY